MLGLVMSGKIKLFQNVRSNLFCHVTG